MAGKIHKFLLFQPWVWFKHLPDWRAVRAFYPHFVTTKKDRRDDTLLSAVIDDIRPRRHHVRAGDRLFTGATRESGTTHETRPFASSRPRTSSSAGRWPRKWAVSTSAKA